MQETHDPWNDPQPEDRQFSLLGLMVLVTVLSVAMAPIGWLPPKVFAGAMGVLALVTLCLVAWLKPQHAIVTVGWWCLFILYLVAAVLASL